MQKDNDDERNTRQPQHQVTKHRVLLYQLSRRWTGTAKRAGT